MTSFSDAFPSRFAKAADLNGQERLVTIANIVEEEVAGKKALVAYFHFGKSKPQILNKTCADVLKDAFGDDTRNSLNRDVIQYEAIVPFRGQTVPSIRIKLPRAGAGSVAPNVMTPGTSQTPPTSQTASQAVPQPTPQPASAVSSTQSAGPAGNVVTMTAAGRREDMNDEIPF